jgi:hypothetical protein
MQTLFEHWWFRDVLIPILITVLPGGLVAYYASVMAVRLTFFMETRLQAAIAISEAYFKREFLKAPDGLKNWYFVVFETHYSSLRIQGQNQAAEDLRRIAYRIDDGFSFLYANPPPDTFLYIKDIEERRAANAFLYNANNSSKWRDEILGLKPDYSEIARIWRLRFIPRKRVVKVSPTRGMPANI